MLKITESLMKDASEVVHYDKQGIPVYIRKAKLSYYPTMRALCHWHDDIEWIHIVKGEMLYYINGKNILLKENDSLMVNRRLMHYGYANNNTDCDFICLLFQPEILFGNNKLSNDYVQSVYNSDYSFLHIKCGTPETDIYKKIIISLNELHQSSFNNNDYDLSVQLLLLQLWNETYKYIQKNMVIKIEETTDIKIQKEMVSFIQKHYNEDITLDEIALSGNVCRSRCCRIFQKYLKETPINYLNSYRLELASYLLTNSEYSITEIATACGFNSHSYFSKTFFTTYGIKPIEYRKTKKA